MDDKEFGTRDKRGDWAPIKLLEPAPLWLFPPKPKKILAWIPAYFFPYNVLFMISSIIYWFLVIPPVETMSNFSWDWTINILVINMVLAFIWYQGWEVPLYIKKKQANRFKYNKSFPFDIKNKFFWFKNQTIDTYLGLIFQRIKYGSFL